MVQEWRLLRLSGGLGHADPMRLSFKFGDQLRARELSSLTKIIAAWFTSYSLRRRLAVPSVASSANCQANFAQCCWR